MKYLEDLFGLKEKTAVVSGGAGVIGIVMSQALANVGANVAIWSRSQASIDKALSKMDLPSERLIGLKVDTGNESEVFWAVKQTAATLGPPEILINAVGGNMDKSAFVDIDLDKFEKILHLNLVAGLVVPTKIVAKFWIKEKIKGFPAHLDTRIHHPEGQIRNDRSRGNFPECQNISAHSDFHSHKRQHLLTKK